jgi:hypothetical protein
MNNRRLLALVLLVPFTALTIYAVIQVGYIGIFDYHRHSPAGWQVFSDLVVALILIMTWMFVDAKKSGRNPVPWIVLTLFLGSIGPLLYLFFSRVKVKKSDI